jgi:uncharacterized coiled-coil protein SlyX
VVNKRQITALDRALARHQAEVAKVRDKLEDAISEWEDLRDGCREAYDDIQRARDALSRLV